MPNDLPHDTFLDDRVEKIVHLLERPVSTDLVFDDESLDAVLYGGPPSTPTPADVSSLFRSGVDESNSCLRAFAAVLAMHPEELDAYIPSAPAEKREIIVQNLMRMAAESHSEDLGFLMSLRRCMVRLGRSEEVTDLAPRVRALELRRKETAFLQRLLADPRDSAIRNEFALFLKNEARDYVRAERYYREALQLSPGDPNYMNNLAVLMMSLERYGEAEQYLRQSLELNLLDANATANLATLLYNCGGRIGEASEMFQRSIKIDPSEASARANYAAMLICEGAWRDAELHMTKGWEAQGSRHDRISARILFLRIAINLLEGKDLGTPLGQLKTLLDSGISHASWLATAVRSYVRAYASTEDVELLEALFGAIVDWRAVAQLTGFRRWTDQSPIPLSFEWT